MLGTNELLQGRYRITRQLGQGGMGAVYEAEDGKQFGKTVALKEILTSLTNNADDKQHELFRSAFEREAKILMQVDHEAFPQVIDYFSEGSRQFLVMQLIQGKDLNDLLIRRQGSFPIEQVCNWADQLLDALDYLHTLDPPIIHRDIKPQNLKLTNRGKIKLLDFGIAKGVDPKSSVTITNATMVAATLHYSPSEQLLRVIDPITREALQMIYGEKMEHLLEQNADLRSDIYSLAATLYHLLTNKPPTDSLKRTIEFWRENPDNLIPANKINPEIPQEISDWLIKAMEIDRDKRFVSALEMRNALRRAAAGESQREAAAGQLALAEQQEKLRIERENIERERENIERERLEHQRQLERERERHAALESQNFQGAPTVVDIPPEDQAIIAEYQQKYEPPIDAPDTFLTQPTFTPPVEPPPPANFPTNEIAPPENTTAETEVFNSQEFTGNITSVSYPDNLNISEEDTAVKYAGFSYTDAPAFKPDAPVFQPDAPVFQPENKPVEPEIFAPAQTPPPAKRSNNNIFWIIPLAALALIFMGGIALGMWLFLGNNSNKSAEKDSPANTKAVNQADTSTTTTQKDSLASDNSDTKDNETNTSTKTPAPPTVKTPSETKNTTTAPKTQTPPVQRTPPPAQTTKKDTPPPPKRDRTSKNKDCIFTKTCGQK